MPWTRTSSGRRAVTRGSFCRSDPAAALRGLANGLFPAAVSSALRAAKPSIGKNTSPRTSSRAGKGWESARSRSGTEAMVRTFRVMSSPVQPSPRVSARSSTPSV